MQASPFFLRVFRCRSALVLLGAGALACPALWGQNTVQSTPPPSTSSSAPKASQSDAAAPSGKPTEQAPPPALDPTGPAVALETNEAVFDVMAGLNACGYDEGLSISDPVRQKARDLMNQALAQSEPARAARDNLCSFVRSHTLGSPRHNLAQYVSLALYLNPPPALTPSLPTEQLPPDAEPLAEYASLLRTYAEAVNLHLIWALLRPAYDAEVSTLHDPMTKMILDMDLYLKQPPSQYSHRRFVVILEPLIAPGQVNARVYGGDYVVVASPVNGVVRMKEIKHTYLHYELEPLLYARTPAIDKLQPLLERVQTAPLPFDDKSDVVALVTECLIRAIEARTMDTGVPNYTPPAHVDRSQISAVNNLINAHDRQVAAVRKKLVQQDMEQGYILTQYFYDQLAIFESDPVSLQEAVGEMVYSIDVPAEKARVQRLVFSDHVEEDVVERPNSGPDLLDQAELNLASGNTATAGKLAQQALAQHTPHAGRAQFILARVDLFSGKPEAAVTAFQQAIQLSHDPRTVAWSHIYLGRIDDVEDNRDDAVIQYKAALQSRDSRPDTKHAADQGLKQPYHLPTAADAPPSSAAPTGAPPDGSAR